MRACSRVRVLDALILGLSTELPSLSKILLQVLTVVMTLGQ
jgi:hypothetical protein